MKFLTRSFLLSSLIAPGIASAALVGYWDFDADFDDQSGNNNHGTAVGAGTTLDGSTSAAGSSSVKFDNGTGGGGINHVSINHGAGGMHISDLPVFTFSAWVKSGETQLDRRFFSEGTASNDNPLYNLGTGFTAANASKFDFYRRIPGGAATNNHEISNASPFGDGTWHHIVVNDTSGAMKLYIDGVLDRTFTYTDSTLGVDSTTFGGILRATACCGFTGNMDDIAIWDESLNRVKIAALAASVPPTLIDDSIDSDSDGLPDYWELLFGLGDADGNPDGDGLTNLEEFTKLTNPNLRDTDGDGVDDDADPDPNDPLIPLPALPTSGLVHLWRFDEASGNTAADSVGNNTATWIGDPLNTSWVTGGFLGGAVDMDGDLGNRNGQHFTLANNLAIDGKTTFSISLWYLNRGNGDTTYNGIFMSRPSNWGIAARDADTIRDSAIDFRYANSGTGSQGTVFSGLTPSATDWHHAAMSVNTTTGELIYAVDGVITSTVKIGAAPTVSGAGWAIGNDGATGTNRDFDGRIDDLSVWDVALTANEINAIYRNGLAGNGISTSTGNFIITDFEVFPDSSFSVTWNSKPDINQKYIVKFSPTLQGPITSWGDFNDNVPSSGTKSTTYTSAPGAVTGLTQFYIAIVEK